MTQQDRTSDDRIDALETRIMHQDRILEDLNETITAQWRQIDRLARQIAGLIERTRESGMPSGGVEPPPPHY